MNKHERNKSPSYKRLILNRGEVEWPKMLRRRGRNAFLLPPTPSVSFIPTFAFPTPLTRLTPIWYECGLNRLNCFLILSKLTSWQSYLLWFNDCLCVQKYCGATCLYVSHLNGHTDINDKFYLFREKANVGHSWKVRSVEVERKQFIMQVHLHRSTLLQSYSPSPAERYLICLTAVWNKKHSNLIKYISFSKLQCVWMTDLIFKLTFQHLP